MMMAISSIQEKVLLSLAEFRYLTMSQLLVVIDECNTYKTLWYHIDRLYKPRKPFIRKIAFNTISRIGRVEDVYYLTPLGLEIIKSLVIDPEDIFLAKNPQLSTDYQHRKYTIDFHIHLKKQNNLDIDFYIPYFITKGTKNGFTSINKVELLQAQNSIIPDAAFQIKYEGDSRFFLLEWHNGTDIRRILSQVHHHALAMTSGVVHGKYSLPSNKAYYVMIVFEEQVAKNKFLFEMEKSKVIYHKIASFFGVKYKDEVQGDFLLGWVDILGSEMEINI